MTSVPRPEVIYNDEILRKHGLRDPACAYHLESTASDGDGGRVVGDGWWVMVVDVERSPTGLMVKPEKK